MSEQTPTPKLDCCDVEFRPSNIEGLMEATHRMDCKIIYTKEQEA